VGFIKTLCRQFLLMNFVWWKSLEKALASQSFPVIPGESSPENKALKVGIVIFCLIDINIGNVLNP